MNLAVSPKLSVIIPCFNAAETVVKQLESLARQSDDTPPFEVLVVDNRSTDNLHEAIKSKSHLNALDLRLISANGAAGASYARNVGAKHARTAYLLYCDADDVVGSNFVRYGFATLEVVPLFSASVMPKRANEFPQDVSDVWRFLDEPAFWSPPTKPVAANGIPVLMGGGFGIHRQVYLSLGGFDQSLRSVGEDNDFGFRAQAAGIRIARADCVKVAYRTSSHQKDRLKIIRRESSTRALLVKRYGLDPSSVIKRWKTEPIRVILAKCKALLLRSDPDVHHAISDRWAASCAFLSGMVRYSMPSRLPEPLLGCGLDLSLERSNTAGPE